MAVTYTHIFQNLGLAHQSTDYRKRKEVERERASLTEDFSVFDLLVLRVGIYRLLKRQKARRERERVTGEKKKWE